MGFSAHLMPGGLNWNPDIISESELSPANSGRRQVWSQTGPGVGADGSQGVVPGCCVPWLGLGICVNTSIVDLCPSSAPRCNLVMM